MNHSAFMFSGEASVSTCGFAALFKCGRHAWVDHDLITKLRREYPNLGQPFTWPSDVPAEQRPGWSDEERRYREEWDIDPNYDVLRAGAWKWSLWYHVTDPPWLYFWHGVVLLSMVCLTVGLWTRVAAVLTWIGMLSYVHRAPTTLFGMDTIMNVVVLYLMIGPSGSVLSLDRWLARWRARRRGLTLAADEPPRPQVSANLALRVMQIHLCIIYFASGISKLQGTTWWMGTAVWGTMANYEFSPMHYRWYLESLRFLSRHRWLWEIVITTSTTFTLAFEIGFPFLVWHRSLRGVMILSAVLLHIGIALFMGLVGFSCIMIVLALSFVPAETWRRWFNALDRWRLTPLDDSPRSALPAEAANGLVAAKPR